VKNRHKVPVILIAAHNGNPQRLIGALDAGADDYIYKPLDKIELQERVKATLWEARQ
jgi:DNA-binding response OmpR family regulator